MGNIAQQADVAVITSDNPRSEDPQTILDEISAGMTESRHTVHSECDRRKAIDLAVRSAHSGDIVLVAGKGHEKEQIIQNERIPFDDCQVIRDCLEQPSSSACSIPSLPQPHLR